MEKIEIRLAEPEDAGELLAIYAPYVEETAITFEYTVPSLAEFQERIRHTRERYPYLVASSAGKIVGYAYAGPFKGRRAYDWAVETSIYVARGAHRQGVGRRLYEALEQCLKKQGILNRIQICCLNRWQESEDDADRHRKQYRQHDRRYADCHWCIRNPRYNL